MGHPHSKAEVAPGPVGGRRSEHATRYTVVEIVHRTSHDGERERYMLRKSNEYGPPIEAEYSATEILAIV